jgi:hypothetical protein
VIGSRRRWNGNNEQDGRQSAVTQFHDCLPSA